MHIKINANYKYNSSVNLSVLQSHQEIYLR